KGRIIDNKFKAFKKIVIFTSKENNICSERKITKECLSKCGYCVSKEQESYIQKWFDFLADIENEKKKSSNEKKRKEN
ncbi:MAG: hypothetical protein LBV11_09470, partial [Bacillus cereus]|nr:hypothetical protein [Bacillus cereus]